MVTLELVLPREPVVSTVLTSEYRARKLRRIGAVSIAIVTLQIGKFLGRGIASFLETVIFSIFTEMRSFVFGKLQLESL